MPIFPAQLKQAIRETLHEKALPTGAAGGLPAQTKASSSPESARAMPHCPPGTKSELMRVQIQEIPLVLPFPALRSPQYNIGIDITVPIPKQTVVNPDIP